MPREGTAGAPRHPIRRPLAHTAMPQCKAAASIYGSLRPQGRQPSLNCSQIQSGLPLDAPKRAPGGRPNVGGSEWLVRLFLKRQSPLEEVRPALPGGSPDLANTRVDVIARDPRRLCPPGGACRASGKNEKGLSTEDLVQIDTGVCDEVRRGAHGLVAEVEVPRGLPNRRLQLRVGMLPFGQHARPEGHVAEIPSRRECVRVPGMPPDMANAKAGAAFDEPSGIARPSPLGRGVVTQPDLPSPPSGSVAPVAFRIVLATEPSPVRVKGRFLPNPVRVKEVGLLKRSPEHRRAAAMKIAFQRRDRRHEIAIVNADLGQSTPPTPHAPGTKSVRAPR